MIKPRLLLFIQLACSIEMWIDSIEVKKILHTALDKTAQLCWALSRTNDVTNQHLNKFNNNVRAINRCVRDYRLFDR